MKKLLNNLWYLSPEPTAFSFFDDDVSNETKKRMSAALFRGDDEAEAIEPDEEVEEETNIPEKRLSLGPEKLEEILLVNLMNLSNLLGFQQRDYFNDSASIQLFSRTIFPSGP